MGEIDFLSKHVNDEEKQIMNEENKNSWLSVQTD